MSDRVSIAVALVAATLSAPVLAGEPGAQGRVARIGVLAPDGAETADAGWGGLAAYLDARLPDVRFVVESYDLPGLRRAVAEKRVDFFIANPGLYVELEAAQGASRIATLDDPTAPSPDRAIASAIVVRADSALRTLADLRGRRVQAVDRGAFGGWQVAWREMERAGVEAENDLGRVNFSGFPMRSIVSAVQEGSADAGVVRRCLLESLEARGLVARGELRVLAPQAAPGEGCERSTPLYPDWPFAVLRHASRELAQQVAVALLQRPRRQGEPGWSIPVDYQPVHELMRELRIGPYESLRHPALADVIERYRAWLLVAAALVAAGIAHALRVEALVMRRTRQLREALKAREAAEARARDEHEKMDHLARLSILGEMSSMLAHEMNQPLATIGNYAAGMGRRLEAGRTDPAPLLEASREIGAQAERAAAIMQRIRAFARKRSGVRERVDLASLIESALALYGAVGRLTPVARGALAKDAIVVADRVQVEQVLLNLFKNAHDAVQTRDPGSRRVEVSLAREGGTWRVAVSDNGPPVDDATRARLFEPFFTTKADGLGLGLAICRSALEAHGGRLWARATDPAGGLIVGFDLPCAEP